MADRRANVRAVVRLEVQNANLQRVPLYVSANLSRGGMFLITKNPLPENTELRLRFKLPADAAAVDTLARVLWVREESPDPGKPPGMGVKFVDCSAADRQRLHQFLETWDGPSENSGPAEGGGE